MPVPLGGGGEGKCPVCQERFESVWDQKLDMPVWKDAIEVKGLGVAHYSCWEEAYGKRGVSARGTPEASVLGKRKIRD